MAGILNRIRIALGLARTSNTPEMAAEISAAALWWSNALRQPGNACKVPEPVIQCFRDALIRQLQDFIVKSDPHGRSWRPDDPRLGSYVRTYAASIEDGIPPGSTLALAAAEAGIADIGSRLPRRVLMRIDPGYVEVAGVGVVWGVKP